MSEEEKRGGEVTMLLSRVRGGDTIARDELMSLVYNELRRIAARQMSREHRQVTLQPTALVHEAWMRIAQARDIEWQSRAHFFAVAAQIMRRILVDAARERHALKRGAGTITVPLDDALLYAQDNADSFLALDDALRRLETFDGRKSKVVEMRFFGGLTEEEIGEVLGISVRTVKREWNFARAWLLETMQA